MKVFMSKWKCCETERPEDRTTVMVRRKDRKRVIHPMIYVEEGDDKTRYETYANGFAMTLRRDDYEYAEWKYPEDL